MEMTFIEVANEWLETHQGSISYSTQTSYRCCINLMKPLHPLKMIEIKYASLQKLINDKYSEGYSKSQLHKIKIVLSQIYKHGIMQEYIEKNYSLLLSLPYNSKYCRREAISDTTVEKILQFKHEYQLYFLTLYYTGIRRGEALALQWKDINFDKEIISITKSVYFVKNAPMVKEPKTKNGWRDVPCPDCLMKALEAKAGLAEQYLFTQKTTGLPHTHTSFRKMQQRWLCDLKAAFPQESIGNITSHMFRHTYITTLFENNLPDYLVKEIVGHADAAFTKRQYYHQSKEYLENGYKQVRNIF